VGALSTYAVAVLDRLELSIFDPDVLLLAGDALVVGAAENSS